MKPCSSHRHRFSDAFLSGHCSLTLHPPVDLESGYYLFLSLSPLPDHLLEWQMNKKPSSSVAHSLDFSALSLSPLLSSVDIQATQSSSLRVFLSVLAQIFSTILGAFTIHMYEVGDTLVSHFLNLPAIYFSIILVTLHHNLVHLNNNMDHLTLLLIIFSSWVREYFGYLTLSKSSRPKMDLLSAYLLNPCCLHFILCLGSLVHCFTHFYSTVIFLALLPLWRACLGKPKPCWIQLSPLPWASVGQLGTRNVLFSVTWFAATVDSCLPN